MKIDLDLVNAIYRTNFGAFAYRAFEAINPGQPLIANWHIDVICYQLQQMVNGDARKRLVINLPRRSDFYRTSAHERIRRGRQRVEARLAGSSTPISR